MTAAAGQPSGHGAPSVPGAPTAEAMENARLRIAGKVHRTPLLVSRTLDRRVGARVFLKAEHLQRGGAFKARGAMNAVFSLGDHEAARGVVTHSSGNHAQAIALAAAERGMPAWVVMPEDAPAIKRAAVEGYGATVVLCERTLRAREREAARVVAETGACFIHAYDDERVIAGQASCVAEMLEDAPPLAAIYVPVGGGGLASGSVLAAARSGLPVQVVLVEPAGADDAARSLEGGVLLAVESLPTGRAETMADGLRTSLCERTFGILRAHGTRVVRVSETAIGEAMTLLAERLKQVVEPSGATALAGLLTEAGRYGASAVAAVLSGGNRSI